MSNLASQCFYRRRLPHYQPPGATLFITFRLAGSLPQAAIERLVEEAKQIEKRLSQIADPHERARETDLAQRRLFGKWDKLLDTSTTGPHWLKQSKIAALVAESLHHRDQTVYDLHAYCIMSNHTHLVCKPMIRPDGSYHAMSAIMHSLKRHTAEECNQVLGCTSEFWQHENYDHVVRNEAAWRRIVRYVIRNPVSAGLVEQPADWKWSHTDWSCSARWYLAQAS